MAKRVLIVQGSVGGAHLSMAQAISERVLTLEPLVKVDSIDAYSAEYSSFPMTATPKLYRFLTTSCPVLWNGLYHATDGYSRYTLTERLTQPFIRPKLKSRLRALEPDFVVSVLPTLSYTLRAALDELGMHVPLGVVVADLVTIHTAWRYRKATWYVTPTAEARQTFIAAGIDPNAVHAFGLPIGRSFSQDPGHKPSLRQRLSLPPHQPIVLIVGGGSGSGPIEAAVAALSSADLAIFLVVVTGRNERLYQRLIQKTSNQTCRILRFVNDMADWMHTADVLVTKAGPATIIEAIHCGLPMVLTGALPQEQGNVAHVLSHGLGLLATTPQEITTCVCKLLTDRALSARMMAAMASLRHPQAAQQIAELIFSHPEATV